MTEQRKRPPLFICEHGKRDDEDCTPCAIHWEERMIAVAEDDLAKSRAKLAALKEDGWAIVPVSTSVGMRVAGLSALDAAKPAIGAELGFSVMQEVYRAMLKAAPDPSEVK